MFIYGYPAAELASSSRKQAKKKKKMPAKPPNIEEVAGLRRQ